MAEENKKPEQITTDQMAYAAIEKLGLDDKAKATVSEALKPALAKEVKGDTAVYFKQADADELAALIRDAQTKADYDKAQPLKLGAKEVDIATFVSEKTNVNIRTELDKAKTDLADVAAKTGAPANTGAKLEDTVQATVDAFKAEKDKEAGQVWAKEAIANIKNARAYIEKASKFEVTDDMKKTAAELVNGVGDLPGIKQTIELRETALASKKSLETYNKQAVENKTTDAKDTKDEVARRQEEIGKQEKAAKEAEESVTKRFGDYKNTLTGDNKKESFGAAMQGAIDAAHDADKGLLKKWSEVKASSSLGDLGNMMSKDTLAQANIKSNFVKEAEKAGAAADAGKSGGQMGKGAAGAIAAAAALYAMTKSGGTETNEKGEEVAKPKSIFAKVASVAVAVLGVSLVISAMSGAKLSNGSKAFKEAEGVVGKFTEAYKAGVLNKGNFARGV